MLVPRLHRLLIVAVVSVWGLHSMGCHGGGQGSTNFSAAGEAPVSVSQAGLRGDLNGSGLPDITDAVGILRIIVGLDPANALADCDCDDAMGISDAIALLRCLVGLAPWPITGLGSVPGDEYAGPDGQTLLWVPGGSFMMGSEDGYPNERPIHRVTLEGFWIGQCEVTNAQYQAFCTATGRTFPSGSNQGDDHPAVYVSWGDAKAYCDHYGYALPTEAQWEYAARGPAVPVYPWGDTWDLNKCCNWDNRGPDGSTYPVGSFPAGASWCGALDMAGNVWEWCADWYDREYYRFSPELNPPGPPQRGTGVGIIRPSKVLRGGSWGDSTSYCRAASREYSSPPMTYHVYGFRVSRSRL